MAKSTNYVFNYGQCSESGLHCIPNTVFPKQRKDSDLFSHNEHETDKSWILLNKKNENFWDWFLSFLVCWAFQHSKDNSGPLLFKMPPSFFSLLICLLARTDIWLHTNKIVLHSYLPKLLEVLTLNNFEN